MDGGARVNKEFAVALVVGLSKRECRESGRLRGGGRGGQECAMGMRGTLFYFSFDI